MAKKEAKKTTKKKNFKTTIKASKDIEKLNTILIENFVSLQKAMTNLATKFDELAGQISKLLQLFEISAKSFSEKLSTGTPEIEKDRDFLDKLNRLLEQNKVIAKGLTLMEEKIRERMYREPAPTQMRRPLQRFPQPAGPTSTQQPANYIPGSLGKTRRTREIE